MNLFNQLKNHKIIILIISLVLNIILVISTGYLAFLKVNDANQDITFDEPVASLTEEKVEDFYVDIKGEVKKPGVYTVNNNTIINDVIKMAGGFTKNAYKNNLNLSKKVSDELVIYIYSKSEYKKKNTPVSQTLCECSSYDISNCLTNTSSSEIISSDKDTIVNNNPTDNNQVKLVNINTASKTELTSLSGIGESKADDIINYRNTNGSFKNIEEIKNVSGIGDALYEKIKDKITV